MRVLKVALACIAMTLMLGACGKDEKFKIEGELVGGQTMNLYIKYYGDDALMSGVTAANQGKFAFVGRSKRPAIVEVLDNEYRVLGRAYVSNGDKVTMRIDRSNPFNTQVKGTPINVEWSKVCNDNAELFSGADHAAANLAIEQYIAANPESLVGPLLFATAYDATVDLARADSVANSFSADLPMGHILDSYAAVSQLKEQDGAMVVIDTLTYRPSERDTVKVFTPGKKNTLLVVTVEMQDRNDSLPQRLARIHKKGKVDVLDIMVAPDTTTWKRYIRRDTAKWEQGWMPGGLYAKGLDKLVIPSTPYFILIDSAGRQLERSTTLPEL